MEDEISIIEKDDVSIWIGIL